MAYVYHPLIVVPLQMAALGLALPSLAKFALVTLLSVRLVFLFAAWARQSRAVRAVL